MELVLVLSSFNPDINLSFSLWLFSPYSWNILKLKPWNKEIQFTISLTEEKDTLALKINALEKAYTWILYLSTSCLNYYLTKGTSSFYWMFLLFSSSKETVPSILFTSFCFYKSFLITFALMTSSRSHFFSACSLTKTKNSYNISRVLYNSPHFIFTSVIFITIICNWFSLAGVFVTNSA